MDIKIYRPGVKLSTYEKKVLADAYFKLYNALVQKFRSKNMSVGESWFNALHETEKLIERLNTQKPTIATEYLTDFCKSHKSTESKKMMTDKDKDKIVPSTKSATETDIAAEVAVQEFEKAVTSFDTLTILTDIKPDEFSGGASKNFFAWLQTLPKSAYGNLDNPRSFQRLYNKFAARQHK